MQYAAGSCTGRALTAAIDPAPRQFAAGIADGCAPLSDSRRGRRRLPPRSKARFRSTLLHRCKLEAAGILLVEYFHLSRLHIPGKVDGKIPFTDRYRERGLDGTIWANGSRERLTATGLHRELIARVRKVEEQIRDIGILAIGRRPRFKRRLCPPSLGKRQRRYADNAQYDEGGDCVHAGLRDEE